MWGELPSLHSQDCWVAEGWGNLRSGKNFTFSLEFHLVLLIIVFLCHPSDFWMNWFCLLWFCSLYTCYFLWFFPLGLLWLSLKPQQLGFWILRVASAWPATNRWSWRTSLRCLKKAQKNLTWSLFGALCWHDFLNKSQLDRPRRARCRLCWMSTRWCTARRDVKISILWPKRELFMSLMFFGWKKVVKNFSPVSFERCSQETTVSGLRRNMVACYLPQI